MKTKIYLSIALCFFSMFLFAAPYHGEKVKFKQPDGSYVTVKLFGDEYYMRAESLDGYTLIRDEATGWISYAKLSDDKTKLISTGVQYKDGQLTKKGQLQKAYIVKNLDISKETRNVIAQSNFKMINGTTDTQKKSLTKKESNALVSGSIKGLTIVVDFSDEPASIDMNKIRDFFNKTGYTDYGNNGSVKDFFYDISGGAIVYENVVYGYYRAPKTFAEYDRMPYAEGAQQILSAALNWINNQGFDFNTLTIKNGTIQAINLMYTGDAKVWAQGMWYHQGSYSGFSADGVRSGKYNTSPVNNDLSIGTVCHENGHMLANWPDTYSYDNSPDGIGSFDLMCYGGEKNPCPPNPYFRNLAGWGTTVNINSVNQRYTEASNSLKTYKYTNPSNSKEYFLIEPRKKTGRSSIIPDEGLTIWRINEDGDNQKAFKQVNLEHANNNKNQHNGACWREGSVTTFNDGTAPTAKWSNGSNSGLKVSQVGPVGTSMSFNIGEGTTTGAKATMTSPTAGSTLGSSSVTFNWNRPIGTTNFDLIVGTTGAGSDNIRKSAVLNETSLAVSGLPTDGSTVYVRLWSYNGDWVYEDYTYKTSTPSVKATISSPAAGSTLASNSVKFTWNRPSGTTNFDLIVGTTGAGSDNIRKSAVLNDTSLTVSNLPTDGGTVYVRLWSYNGNWVYEDYTYKASTASIKARMTSPTAGNTLASSSVKFSWDRPNGAKYFDIVIGSTGIGSDNIRKSAPINDTSLTVDNLPTDGNTVYVRLWTNSGDWAYEDYTYKASTIAEKAAMISPVAGSTLASSSVKFTWNRPAGTTYYDLIVGTNGVGSNNIRSTAPFNDTSLTVSSLPIDGSTVYVRLWSYKGGWSYVDYTYKASSGAKITMISPTAGSTLASSSVKFSWNRPTGVSNFDILIGTTGPGSTNIRRSAIINSTSLTVSGLPTNGSTLYVRLWSYNQKWEYKDYTYKTSAAIHSLPFINNEDVALFPNPATDKFVIKLGQLKNPTVSIFNNTGKLIFNQIATDNQIEVDSSKFTPGLYFVHISNENETIIEKLIIN